MMNVEKYRILQSAIAASSQAGYSLQSRVHRLRSFPKGCYIKRDDELGFGISGSKIRKFHTLIPALLKKKIEKALIIGGAYSNNVVGIVQLLIENGIVPILFLRGGGSEDCKGNYLLIRLLVDENAIHWVGRSEWPFVEKIAKDYSKELAINGISSVVIPEGSASIEAIPGAATLALDIVRNESQLSHPFKAIFMDAGTGMTAAVTLLSMTFIEKETKTYIVQLADQKGYFEKTLERFYMDFQAWLQCSFSFPSNFEVLYSKEARSFGSVNAAVFNGVKRLAREEGIFTDPIYTAKLLITAKDVLEKQPFLGNQLIIHSGGGLTLAGYQRDLEKTVNNEGICKKLI